MRPRVFPAEDDQIDRVDEQLRILLAYVLQ